VGTDYSIHIAHSHSVKAREHPNHVSPRRVTAVNSTIQARLGP
jgi:hypothetical protein